MKNNLYKLVIAYEEEAIRIGLSSFLGWEELGYEVVAVYEDGSEIITHLEDGKEVDVILNNIVINEASSIDVLNF